MISHLNNIRAGGNNLRSGMTEKPFASGEGKFSE